NPGFDRRDLHRQDRHVDRNHMCVTELWTTSGTVHPDAEAELTPMVSELLTTLVLCNNAELEADGGPIGDPTEITLLETAASFGLAAFAAKGVGQRSRLFR